MSAGASASDATPVDSESRSVDRRTFLTAGAGWLVGPQFASQPGTASIAPTTDTDSVTSAPPSFVDLVHEEALDAKRVRESFAEATGEPLDVAETLPDHVVEMAAEGVVSVPIDSQLRQAAREGRVAELPAGTFRTRGVTSPSSGFGIRGQGSAQTRIVGRGRTLIIDARNGVSDILAEGFGMHNPSDSAGVGMSFSVGDALYVSDVHHTGMSPREGSNGTSEQFNHQECSLTISIEDADGAAFVEGFVKTSPSEIGGHAQNDSAFASWHQHHGVCYVTDSTVHNSGGDGATYLSRTNGGWRFSRCSFVNCHGCSLRLGGGKSWAIACSISVDINESRRVNEVRASGRPAMNPIVWEHGTSNVFGGANGSGGLIDRCEVTMNAVEACRAALTVDGSHGGIVVRDSTFTNNTGDPTLRFDEASGSHMNNYQSPPHPHPCWVENTVIDGGGSGAAVVDRRGSDGVAVCVRNGAVRGFPSSALGCGGAGGSPPGYVSHLTRDLGDPTVNGGAPDIAGGSFPAGSGVGAPAARPTPTSGDVAPFYIAPAAVAAIVAFVIFGVIAAALISVLIGGVMTIGGTLTMFKPPGSDPSGDRAEEE